MMNTVLLDKDKHDRNRFNCGTEALNNYLKVMASQQAKKDNTRTFVLEDDNNSAYIIGFYTLTMTPIDLKALPDKCSGQLKLATVLEFSQYNRSDSLGVKPPLY
ncbi:hypothetical protein CNRVC190247_03192 [Vibrio cholerae]|nr:hypothetical protein V130003_30820 [Vibrio cholerae]CAH2566888.1 hypothetical protein CNRVC190247_03192 [Vibrio cholerae]